MVKNQNLHNLLEQTNSVYNNKNPIHLITIIIVAITTEICYLHYRDLNYEKLIFQCPFCV